MPKIEWLVEALQMDEEMVFDMVRRWVQGQRDLAVYLRKGRLFLVMARIYDVGLGVVTCH